MTDGVTRFYHWNGQTVGSIVVVCILICISRGWRQDTIGMALLSVRSAIGRPYQCAAYSQHDNDLIPQLQVRKERGRGMNE